MASVYLARRVSDFEQIVAVKLMLEGLYRTELRQRFQAEQQALAALQHPNIVRLIDGGVTEDGVPFLVMEYVDGIPIDVYCRTLTLPQRAHLGVRILEAIHHAHQHLLVHCDLKFSNILVTTPGEPKILDFGIAKILNPEQYGFEQQTTRTAGRPFTPEFASPEQLRGQPLTTSTDIYSMAVLLYWLCTEAHPFETVRDQPVALMKATIDAEPEAPSKLVNSLRGKDAGRDLDAILRKALRKEPEARYGTAAQFAGDLAAWLDGRPVEARRGSGWYRFRRSVVRHRGRVAAAALVVFAMLAGAGATFWQGYRAQRARTQAEARFSEVRKLSNELVFGFYGELQKLPGSAAAQQSIVTWSLSALDNVARQGIRDASLSEEIAGTYRKMAALQGNPHEHNLGKPQEAIHTINRGLAVIRPVLDREPARKTALLEQARLLASRAEIESSAGAMDEARKEKRVVLALLDGLVARYPADYDVLMEACSQYERYGDMLGGRSINPLQDKEAIVAWKRAQVLRQRAAQVRSHANK